MTITNVPPSDSEAPAGGPPPEAEAGRGLMDRLFGGKRKEQQPIGFDVDGVRVDPVSAGEAIDHINDLVMAGAVDAPAEPTLSAGVLTLVNKLREQASELASLRGQVGSLTREVEALKAADNPTQMARLRTEIGDLEDERDELAGRVALAEPIADEHTAARATLGLADSDDFATGLQAYIDRAVQDAVAAQAEDPAAMQAAFEQRVEAEVAQRVQAAEQRAADAEARAANAVTAAPAAAPAATAAAPNTIATTDRTAATAAAERRHLGEEYPVPEGIPTRDGRMASEILLDAVGDTDPAAVRCVQDVVASYLSYARDAVTRKDTYDAAQSSGIRVRAAAADRATSYADLAEPTNLPEYGERATNFNVATLIVRRLLVGRYGTLVNARDLKLLDKAWKAVAWYQKVQKAHAVARDGIIA